MKLIEGAAHCAIAAGCLAWLWAAFWFAGDSPWGVALLGVCIVLVVVLIVQTIREPLPPSRRPLGEDGEHLAFDGPERVEAVRVEGAPGRIEERLRGRPVEPHDPP